MEVFVMSSVYLPCVYSCTQGTCAMRDCLPTVCVCVCRSFQPSLRRMMAYSESLRWGHWHTSTHMHTHAHTHTPTHTHTHTHTHICTHAYTH